MNDELFAHLIREEALLKLVAPIIDEKALTTDTGSPDIGQYKIFKEAHKYLSDYGTLPNKADLFDILKSNESLAVRASALYNVNLSFSKEYAEAKIKEELRRGALASVIFNGAMMLDSNKVDYDALQNEMKDVIRKYDFGDTGVDMKDTQKVFDLVFARAHARKIHTGIYQLDNVLNGGYGIGEITSILASSGRGKSTVLCNFNATAIQHGHETLYLSMELSEAIVVSRICQRMLVSPLYTLHTNKEEAMRQYRTQVECATSIHTVYRPPNECSIEDLENIVDSINLKTGKEIEVIFIDYLDKMKLPTIRGDQDWLQLRILTEMLHDFAERRNVAIVTASQLGRKALTSNRIHEGMIAGSYGKVEAGDVIMAFNPLIDEGNNQAQFILLKVRNTGGTGKIVTAYVDFSRMLVTDNVSLLPKNFDFGDSKVQRIW